MTQPESQSTSEPLPVEIQNLSRECHEVLILGLLESGAHHGYQLSLELEARSGGRFRLNHGTLYPILHKLEKEGLIRGDWLEEATKRKRKSYDLTEAGRRRLAELTGAWRSFFKHFFAVLEVRP